VVDVITGVVNVAPVPREGPPVGEPNQFNVPALAVAPMVTVPASQRTLLVVDVIVGIGLIVAITAVRAEVQPLFVTST
jgi:hypothetical protein